MGAGNTFKAAFQVLENVSAKVLEFTNYFFHIFYSWGQIQTTTNCMTW